MLLFRSRSMVGSAFYSTAADYIRFMQIIFNKGIGPTNTRIALRYRAQPEAIEARVPSASFPSKSQILVTSGDGTIAQAIATMLTAVPEAALNLFPAFQALAKM